MPRASEPEVAVKRMGEGPYWRIATWSRAAGKGSIVSGVGTLAFERDVAVVDDFEVGEPVWVTLAPAPGNSFWVTGVTPHLARLATAPDSDVAATPALDEALAQRASSVLSSVPLPFHGHATSLPDGLVLRGWELTTDEYGLAGVDVHLEGELRLIRPAWIDGRAPGSFELARLCRPNERAWAASRTRLGAADLAIALVGRYTGGVTPAASLVVCADVAWTPARRGRGGREIEKEAIRAYEERPYVALRVEERDGGATLVAVNADETVRTVCPVPPEDAHGTAMWADAITEALAGKC